MQNRSFRKKYKKHHVTRKHKLNIKKKYFKIRRKKTKNKRKKIYFKKNIKRKTRKYKRKNITKKRVKKTKNLKKYTQFGGNFYEIPDFSYLLEIIRDSYVFNYIVEFSKFSGEDFIQRIDLSSIQIIQSYQNEIERAESDEKLSEINTRYRLAELNNAIKGSLAYEFYLCFEPAIKSGKLDKKTIMNSMYYWYTEVNAVKTSIKSTSPLDYEIFKGDTITEVWRNYLQFFPNTQTAYLYFCCCWKPENPPVTGIFLSIIVYLLKLPAPKPIWEGFVREESFYPSYIIVDLEFNKMLPWKRVYITKGFENEYVYKEDGNKLSLYDVAVKYLQSGVLLNPFAFLFQEMNIWLADTSNFQEIKNISSRRVAGETMSSIRDFGYDSEINIAILTKYYIMANGNKDIMDKYLSDYFGYMVSKNKVIMGNGEGNGNDMQMGGVFLPNIEHSGYTLVQMKNGDQNMYPFEEIIKLGTFINDSDALSDSVHDSLIGRGGDYLTEDNALKAVCFSDVDDKSANDKVLEELNATFNVLDNRGLLHGDKNIFYGDQIIDAFTSSKFFPLHEGADCYIKNVTRDLSNLIDPATTGKGDLYKCYQKLGEKIRTQDNSPILSSIGTIRDSAAYSANIVFGLCIHFVESIIRSGEPPYAGVENALEILKNIQITRIGDNGDMHFSYQPLSDVDEFEWIASQSVMAYYINLYNSDDGAEMRSSTQERSMFIEKLVERGLDVNTLTALCRLIKYVGDKSHIVLAVTFILFKVSSLPVTILTIDRLLVKCIIQIIKGTRKDTDERFRNIGSKLSFICPAFKIFKNLTNSFNVAESVMTNQNKSKMFLACRELGPDIGLKLWFKKLADLINQYKDKLLLIRGDIGVTIDSNVKYISDLLNDFNKENVVILTKIKEFIENPSSDLSDLPTDIIAIRDIYNEILQIIEREKEVEWNTKFQKLLDIFNQRNPPGRASLRRQPILEFMDLPTINQSTSNAISNLVELFSMFHERPEKELAQKNKDKIKIVASGIRQYLDGRTETSKKILGFKSEDDPIVEHPSLDNLEPSMSKNSVYFNCLKNIETYLKQFKELYEVTGRLIKE